MISYRMSFAIIVVFLPVGMMSMRSNATIGNNYYRKQASPFYPNIVDSFGCIPGSTQSEETRSQKTRFIYLIVPHTLFT